MTMDIKLDRRAYHHIDDKRGKASIRIMLYIKEKVGMKRIGY